jgi:curved DNA-binding protein CbpA
LINYYEVLGVSRDAEESVIRDRFRILARESHPDRFREPEKKKAAEDRFQLLTEAVNVLTSEARRKVHDFELDKQKPAAQDPQSIARVFLAKGVKSYKEGDYRDAVEQFDMAVKHYDKDPKAFHYLAMSCIKVVGQVRKGVDAIEAAIRLDPNNALFHRDAGRLYGMAGLSSKAQRHFEEALTWLPGDPETLRLLQEVRSDPTRRKTPGGFLDRKG